MIPVLHQYPLVTLLLMFGQGPDQLEPTAGAGQSKTENVRLWRVYCQTNYMADHERDKVARSWRCLRSWQCLGADSRDSLAATFARAQSKCWGTCCERWFRVAATSDVISRIVEHNRMCDGLLKNWSCSLWTNQAKINAWIRKSRLFSQFC